MGLLTYNADNTAIDTDSMINGTGINSIGARNLVPGTNAFQGLDNGYNDNTTAVQPLDGMQDPNYSPTKLFSYLSNPDGTNSAGSNFEAKQFPVEMNPYKLPDDINLFPSSGSNSPNGYDYDRLQKLQEQAQADRKTASEWGFGLGSVQLGLDIYNTIGRNQLNQKNMQLIDQQIAQNKQVMSDRTQRNADIAKAFGSNGIMSKPTGL